MAETTAADGRHGFDAAAAGMSDHDVARALGYPSAESFQQERDLADTWDTDTAAIVHTVWAERLHRWARGAGDGDGL